MKKKNTSQRKRSNTEVTVRVAATPSDVLTAAADAIRQHRDSYDANDHPPIDAVLELMHTLSVCFDTPPLDDKTSQLLGRLKDEIAKLDLSGVREARDDFRARLVEIGLLSEPGGRRG